MIEDCDALMMPMHDRVMRLEAALQAGPIKQPKLRHFFAPGIYGREITLDAGDVLTSKVHKQSDLNILSKGRIAFTTDIEVLEVEAPYTFISPPGAKRAGFALTEVVWTTITPNPTNETDLAKLESLFVVDTMQEYLEYRAQLEDKS